MLESLLDQATAESWKHQRSIHESCALAVNGQCLALPVHPDAMETADTPVGKAYRMIEALFISSVQKWPLRWIARQSTGASSVRFGGESGHWPASFGGRVTADRE